METPSATTDRVTTHLNRMKDDFANALRAARKRKIGYCLAAVALANASDGEKRTLRIHNVGEKCIRTSLEGPVRDINDPLSRGRLDRSHDKN